MIPSRFDILQDSYESRVELSWNLCIRDFMRDIYILIFKYISN